MLPSPSLYPVALSVRECVDLGDGTEACEGLRKAGPGEGGKGPWVHTVCIFDKATGDALGCEDMDAGSA